MTLFVLNLICKSREDERPVTPRSSVSSSVCHFPLSHPLPARGRAELRTLAERAAPNTCFRKEVHVEKLGGEISFLINTELFLKCEEKNQISPPLRRFPPAD